ncbi:MAG: trypsin-like peptidase domain-containing protein [Bacteroidota bacterium]
MNRMMMAALLLLVPLAGGGLIGYSLGVASGSGGEGAGEGTGAETRGADARLLAVSGETRDSISPALSRGRRNAITATVAEVSPAVVGINVVELRTYRRWSPWGDDPFFRQFFGDQTYTEKIPSLGSGFLISPDGYILTNDHVAGNAKEITVTLTSGEKYEAELVGTDLISDIALLRIKGEGLPHVRLGNSDDVITGEWVIAFGNPFGLFDISDKPTVTVGVVSAMDMNLRGEEGRVYRGMIQTDAAINSGNSGGPLVNSVGEVIGVNAVIYSPNRGNIGLGFAIPINRVKSIVADLRRSGRVEREFWTGLEIQTVDRRIARYFGLEKAEGAIISDIKLDSPAERAGLRVGDIILALNGEPTPDEKAVSDLVHDARVGDILRLDILREKKRLEVRMKLERRPG